MICKRGDIVLVKFPFTTLLKSKKRPVLVIQNENEYNDFICFQITSQADQSNLQAIDATDIIHGELKLRSFIKYDKCFTLNTELVEKKLASIDEKLMEKIKKLFCEGI
jgi:mRNA interferase MazF